MKGPRRPHSSPGRAPRTYPLGRAGGARRRWGRVRGGPSGKGCGGCPMGRLGRWRVPALVTRPGAEGAPIVLPSGLLNREHDRVTRALLNGVLSWENWSNEASLLISTMDSEGVAPRGCSPLSYQDFLS